MEWFKTIAPFRTKLLAAFGSLASKTVRMEALAAGDFSSPIAFVDHADCVGRICRGMSGFRDAAVAQQGQPREQAEAVRIFAGQLANLSKTGLVSALAM